MKIYLFSSNPIISCHLHTDLGGLHNYNDEAYILYINDILIFNRIVHLLPDFIINGLFYNTNLCVDLFDYIKHYIPQIFPIEKFMIFRYISRLNRISQTLHNTSLYDIMMKNMNINGNIHYLNANLGPRWFFLEGALEMIDYYLESRNT
jgi:hypothetical protein